ncbi:MAG: hypothetical protein K6E30_05895 [Lachnospiraceae bacterium]|nr:hypothetical protein [Lachnospiraceae bacterium]
MPYEYIMYFSIGAGIVFLTISIIFFIYYRVPAVVSELTGRTARREIAAMQSGSGLADKKQTRKIKGKKSTRELDNVGGKKWFVRKRKTNQLGQNEEVSDSKKPLDNSETVQKIHSPGKSVGTEPLDVNSSGARMSINNQESSHVQNGTELLIMPKEQDNTNDAEFEIQRRVLLINTDERIL